MTRTGSPLAECYYCGRQYALCRDGTVRRHHDIDGDGLLCRGSRELPKPLPERRLTEGWIALMADEHKRDHPQAGGCSCGFWPWSGQHVAIMAYREACERVGVQA